MKMNLNKIKKLGKYISGLVAAGTLLSLVVFPALGMKADGPRFNFMTNDYELFVGMKEGANDWADPITVSDGDVFSGQIYYHNGIVDSTATNTRIKVTLPDTFKAGENILTASISADNADTVTDTVINDVPNGPSGLTVKTTEAMDVEYIPGSVKWFPDAKLTGNAEAPLLYGQTGIELFSATGLKIGDILGCWDHAGYVNFSAKVSKHVVNTPNLAIQKSVRNVTADSAYVETIDMEQADTANFKMVVTNNGNIDLNPVKVFDQLPLDLAAVAGTGRLNWHGAVAPFELSDLLSTEGVNLGLMHPGEHAILTFDAVVNNTITARKTIRNIAIAAADDLQRQDGANVVLIPGNVELHWAKSAWNITRNANAETVPACPGDVIEYTLRTANSGTAGIDYIVSDNIADILEYADVVEFGGGIVDRPNIVYPAVPIMPGAEIENHFTIRIHDSLPPLAPNGPHFDDVLVNRYGNDVVVRIYREILRPSLVISKYVRNVSANEDAFVKANTAYAGETLEYKIVFRNNGNGPADYIKIYDVLPANVTLDTTSAAILGANGEERSMSENMESGVIITTLAPGQEAYIRFKAIIASGIAGDQTLTNTAYLTDNNDTISDTAQTVIKTKVVLTKTNPVPTPSLPRTGAADSLVISLFGALALTGMTLARSTIKR